MLELLKKGGNKLLPKLLQHIEADCVIDFTCYELSKKYPVMPLFPIHDSIATIESRFEELSSEVKQLITSYCLGISPKLKEEFWYENCEKINVV